MVRKLFFITVISLTVGLIGCSSMKIGSKTKEEMTDFGKRYAQAWSSKDPNAVAKFYSESGSLKINDGKPAVGRAAIAEVVGGFMTAFPDMIVNMDKVVEKPEGWEFHWELIGTNTGPGGKGKLVLIRGHEQWRLSGDLIAESKGHYDEAEYNRQIEHGIQK